MITGCGHPGVVEVLKRARELLEEDILLVMGGFHLLGKDTADIQGIVSELRQLTSHVAPCHCTGDEANSCSRRRSRAATLKWALAKPSIQAN